MRFVLPLVAVLMASTAMAETFTTQSRVTAVTIYPTEARLTRSAEVSLPAGRHRLVIGGLPYDDEALDTLQISHPGLVRVAMHIGEGFPVIAQEDSAERAEARARVEAVEDQIAALTREAAEARLAADGAEAVLAFLGQLGRGEGAGVPAPEQLREVLTTISEETAQARDTILRAEAQKVGYDRQMADLAADLKAAEAALAALSQQGDRQVSLALDVVATEEITVPLALSYASQSASWGPAYEIKLNTDKTPLVTLQREVMVQQDTGEDWVDVALRVSTSTPDQRIEAGPIYPERRRIEDPAPVAARDMEQRLYSSPMAEVVMEAPVIVEEPDSAISAVTSEAGVSYSFGEPVSIRTGAEIAYLSLPDVTLSAEVSALAVPRRDTTAFRIAKVTNTSGEELLASSNSRFFVDGELIGRAYFPGLIAEAEADLGFGPIDGLRLSRDVLDQSEGGRGVISRSNQRTTVAEIEVENLTDRVWPLRVLDQVPYSEQEDLEITWSASPTPSEENVKKQRGILAWELELQPGSTRLITLNTQLDWPEGKVLQ